MAGAALAACAAPAKPASPTALPAEPTPAPQAVAPTAVPTVKPVEPVTITWFNQFGGDIVNEVMPKMVADFEAQNPDVKVKYELSGGPPGGGDYTEVLMTRIASGDPPDCCTLWTPPVQFAVQGAFLAVDEFMQNAEYAKPGALRGIDSCQWDGKTYGLISSAADGAVFINKKKFEEKGISSKREDFPKTWAELKKLAAEFTVKDGDTLKEVGFVPWADAGFLLPVWSALNGGKLFDSAAKKYVLDSAENIEWFDFNLQWLNDLFGGSMDALNMLGKYDTCNPDTIFAQGLMAMGQDGPWAASNGYDFEYEVQHFPYGPKGTKTYTGYYPNWWALPKAGKHPAEAFRFIEYMSTLGWVTWYRDGMMGIPTWTEFPPDVHNQRFVDLVGAEKAADLEKFFRDYVADAAEMWNSPIEAFATTTVRSALDEVLFKKKTPEQALKEAQALCQAKLEEALKAS
jgi:ABC-type glycerol-3-phosphate transport system substrate-binding protein